jgi:hypothetical protein
VVLGVGDEGEIAGRRLLDSGDAQNLDVAVSVEPAAQTVSEIAKLQMTPIQDVRI